VWLNNPIFPLEASGTSGMKAGFNGTINLSVLDGWWGEGYTGNNGWAIKPASEKLSDERRNLEEARSLYELLQDKVIPLYYQRGDAGFSHEWIQMAKRSIMTLLPVYNSERMVGEYLKRFYTPAAARGHEFGKDSFAVPRDLAQWKRRVRGGWNGVQLRPRGMPERHTRFGDKVTFAMGVVLNGLRPEDIVIELLLTSAVRDLPSGRTPTSHMFTCTGERGESGEHLFKLELAPELCGKLEYRIRTYPYHPQLSHRFEMGLMKWI
jgi:starch phosphorylase